MLRDWAASSAPEPLSSFRFFGRRSILVNDPALVTELLLARDDAFHKGPALAVYSRPLLGNGLLTSEEGFHRSQRRMVAPAFAHRRVASYADTMAHAAEVAQARWAEGETIDLAREMTRLTLGIVGKTLFDADHTGDEADAVGRDLTTLLHYFTDIVRSPFRLPFTYVPPWKRDVRKALVNLDSMIHGLISERRVSGRDTGDLLSMLMLSTEEDDGHSMEDRQIRDEAMTLFLAGHETTANALIWAWYLLASHPDIYARVRAEAASALGGRTPTHADLDRLPLCLQVFKEAMRLYPPAYVVARQARGDTALGGYRIPDRAIVFFSPYLLHRKAEYFPDPDTFNPDRWADAEWEKSLPRHAYVPFGGGQRVCIGAAFALMEGQLILATLAQRVRLEPVSPAPVRTEPLITLRPRGPIPMVVRRDG